MAFAALRRALGPGNNGLLGGAGLRFMSTPRVQDRIINVIAVDEDGIRHRIKGLIGHNLMEALKLSGFESEARHPSSDRLDACSGNCEVTIANEWLDKVPERTEDELEVLRDVTKRVTKNHRLGCQIQLTKDLDGMVVSKVEEKPFEIP
ncbi:hypothetical protein KFL_000580280 [Klebsormidium nitens]|uniref:Ferredoxin n=1 Tax=Klebsormidium nitens TaxID=105231 RepID=A0A1Y1HRB3_KLENI|nr:hypothetical protein KFL_000580280 [Klebsormidium nitens]|eukprot:GAQ80633.1 hypothetical protein KFL_000580280 [Klebsormidium nitens]